MKLAVLRQMIKVNNADATSYKLGYSNRKCKRLTKSDIAWITKHGPEYTSLEVGKFLGHTPNTIRAFARRKGIQLKQVRQRHE